MNLKNIYKEWVKLNKLRKILFIIMVLSFFCFNNIVIAEELYKFLYNLSKDIKNKELKAYYLEKTIQLNPDFEEAKKELGMLTGKKVQVEEPVPQKDTGNEGQSCPLKTGDLEKGFCKSSDLEKIRSRLDETSKVIDKMDNRIGELEAAEKIKDIESKVEELSIMIRNLNDTVKEIDAKVDNNMKTLLNNINVLKSEITEDIVSAKNAIVKEEEPSVNDEPAVEEEPVPVEEEPEILDEEVVEVIEEEEDEKAVPPPAKREAPPVAPPPPRSKPAAKSGKININEISVKELQAVPGVSKLDAILIDRYKKRYGQFKGPEDLYKIPGIKVTPELLNMIEF